MNHGIRISVAALAATALVATLAGCSSTPSEESIELEFVLSGDGSQGGGWQALADKYYEETGITVKIVDVPGDDLTTRLRNSAQAGDLPDLAAAGNVDPLWSSQILDLSDIAEKAKVIDTLLVEDPTDGLVKALPTTLTGVGMFLNTTLWDAAGVSYPADTSESWTWDEYVAKAAEVTAATGTQYGLTVDASAHRLRALLYEFGSQGVVEESDGSFSLDDEAATALEFFKKLHDDGVVPKSVWISGDDASATFKSGQVAGYMSGVWQVADFQANITDFEWASVPLPQEPVRATNYGAASWIVAFDGTGHEQETLDFISWVYSAENYVEYCAISACLPAISEVEVDYTENAASFAVYNAEIAESPAVSAVQTTDQLRMAYEGRALEYEPLKDVTIRYLSGELTIDETIAAIVSETEAQLSK